MKSRAHILVVEDDPLISELLVEVLQDRYDATAVESATGAIQQLRAGAIDLVLLDCTLPGGLGTELLPMVDSAGIPVVLMSGNPETASRIPGSRRFVPKPFAISALIEVVDAMLEPQMGFVPP